MNNYRVLFSKDASIDYLSALEYIANSLANRPAAKKLMADVDEVTERLSSFPQSSPRCADEVLTQRGVRFAVVDSYILFYLVNDDAKTVTYVAFLHSTTNYAKRLIQRID